MEIVASLFGGLGLFFTGVKLIGRNLQHMVGRRFRALVARATGNPLTAALAGTALGVLTQSTNAATFIVINLISAGALTVRRAMPLVAWANLGTSVLVLLAVVDLRLAVLYLLGVTGLCHYFDLDSSARWRHLVGALLGLGVLFLGLQLMKGGAAPLRDLEMVQAALRFAASSEALLVLVGAAVAMVAQSSATVSVLAVTMASAGLFGEEATILLVLGASLGSGATTYLMAGNLEGTPRQLALFQALFKAVGVAILLPLFLIESHQGVALLRHTIDGHIPDLAHRAAAVYLLCQLVPALVLAPVYGPLSRLFDRLLPASRVEAMSRPAFLYDQALVDAESALPLVEREQERLIRHLPDYLDGVRAEPPATGHVPPDELHAATGSVARVIDSFLTELLDAPLSRGALERGVLVKTRQEIIVSLNDSVHELVATIAAAAPEVRAQPLTGNLVESLHALLLTLAEAAAHPEPESIALLIDLTADRAELMERIRRTLLRSETPPPYPVQQALFAMTILFERHVWLIRRYALLLRPEGEAETD